MGYTGMGRMGQRRYYEPRMVGLLGPKGVKNGVLRGYRVWGPRTMGFQDLSKRGLKG